MAISFHRFIDKLGIKRYGKFIRFDKNFVGLMKLCRETPISLPKNCVIHFIFSRLFTRTLYNVYRNVGNDTLTLMNRSFLILIVYLS